MSARIALLFGIATAGLTIMGSASAQDLSARLRLYEGKGGASCSHFLANVLAWSRKGGDWKDAAGQLHGSQAFATGRAEAGRFTWDLLGLVRARMAQGKSSIALMLRQPSGGGYAIFHSREATKVTDWPMLILEMSDGSRKLLKPLADSHLDCSTYMSLGTAEKLTVSNQHNVAIEFALPTLSPGVQLVKANLMLFPTVASGKPEIGAFELAVPTFPSSTAVPGLAARYPMDQGIDRDPSVLFATSFEPERPLLEGWSRDSSGEVDRALDTRAFGFAPLTGAALRVLIKQGDNLGADLRLRLKDLKGGEPDELYFRYYLRLGSDWNPQIADGKMPGLSGTYGKSGWGGRRTDGSTGWSMRGSFLRGFERGHPFEGLTQMGTYAYHADMEGTYGDVWYWPGALFERNRWYCVEQYVRLNHIGASDGVLKIWVDGRQLLERSNVRMRIYPEIRIEMVWANIFHGGSEVSPKDQHVFLDNLVVAQRYIGPMGEAKR